jgi:hypothetical protein
MLVLRFAQCITMYHIVSSRKLLNPAIFLLAMTEPRVALLVRVPLSLKSRLAEIAKHERRSLSKQVELLLERCLELQSREGIAAPVRGTRRRES